MSSVDQNHSVRSTPSTLTQHQQYFTHTTTTPNKTTTPNLGDLGSTPESNSDLLHHFRFFNVYKDGRITFFSPPAKKIPPSDDPFTGVKIKDVQISSDVSARIFLPPTTTTGASAGKFPVVLYIHGGAFCMQSAFSVEYTRFLAGLAAGGEVIAVSVEYGLFPDRPIPACYEDSWAALQWVTAHAGACTCTGAGAGDPWLSNHGDFGGLFIGGDSAGANICHTLAVRAGSGGLPGGVEIKAVFMIHPFFGEDDKMWMYMCPSNEGPRDRRMRPPPEDLERIQCGRVLVMIAEKDRLRDGGKKYVDDLIKSEWEGTVEIVDHVGKGHCFHLLNPDDEEANAIQNRIMSFIHSS